MKRFFKITGILAITLLIVLPFASIAHAEGLFSIDSVATSVISKGLTTTTYLLGFAGGWLVQIAAQMVNWSLNLNSNIISSRLVQVGWLITRDLANLGFVLAIILIAFFTIFRFNNYDTKNMLVKLVISALLINFSLVIAGVFVDFAGVLTNFFLSKATAGNPVKLGENLANAFQAQRFLQTSDDLTAIKETAGQLIGNFGGWPTLFASLFFSVIFTLIAAISIGAVAVMLFVRYIWLVILIILMPIAWLLRVLPDTESKWKRWWSEFFHWVFFAPAVTFFIYLAFALLEDKAEANKTLALDAARGLFTTGTLQQNAGETIGQMIALTGILIGGLKMASEMSVTFADTAMGLANKVTGTLIGGTVKGAGGLAGKAAGGTTGWIKEKALTAGAGGGKESYLQRASAWLANKPIPGARTLSAGIAKTTKASLQDVEKYQKENISSLTNDALMAMAKNPLNTNSINAAIARELAGRRDATGIPLVVKDKGAFKNDGRLLDLMRDADKLGSADALISARPDLALQLGKTKVEIYAKVKSEDRDKLGAKFFTDENGQKLLLKLKGEDLGNFAKKWSGSDQEEFIESLHQAIAKITDINSNEAKQFRAIASQIRRSPAWPVKIDLQKIPNLYTPEQLNKVKKEEEKNGGEK